MANRTNNRQLRRNKQRNNGSVTQATELTIVSPSATVAHITSFDQPIRQRMVDKIIDVCQTYKMTIFGSYVRERMCDRPFNPEISDIDIFSFHTVPAFVEVIKREGFSGDCEQEITHNTYNMGKKFSVSHLTLRMINDEFFTSKSIKIKVDYVNGVSKDQPLFDNLDFSCNGWIWDDYGIRLSRRTGTELDQLSAFEIKKKELQILEEAKNFITEYYPIDKEGQICQMDTISISRRKIRIARIVKMIQSGWSIKNFDSFFEEKLDHHVICPICEDKIVDLCLKMKCCTFKYHHHCFISHASAELEDRSYILCPQCCSEIHL